MMERAKDKGKDMANTAADKVCMGGVVLCFMCLASRLVSANTAVDKVGGTAAALWVAASARTWALGHVLNGRGHYSRRRRQTCARMLCHAIAAACATASDSAATKSAAMPPTAAGGGCHRKDAALKRHIASAALEAERAEHVLACVRTQGCNRP